MTHWGSNPNPAQAGAPGENAQLSAPPLQAGEGWQRGLRALMCRRQGVGRGLPGRGEKWREREESGGCRACREAGGLLMLSWEHSGSESISHNICLLFPGEETECTCSNSISHNIASPLPKKFQVTMFRSLATEGSLRGTHTGPLEGSPTTLPTVSNKGLLVAGPILGTRDPGAPTLSDIFVDDRISRLYFLAREHGKVKGPCVPSAGTQSEQSSPCAACTSRPRLSRRMTTGAVVCPPAACISFQCSKRPPRGAPGGRERCAEPHEGQGPLQCPQVRCFFCPAQLKASL